jgi:uncharacterized protein YukE
MTDGYSVGTDMGASLFRLYLGGRSYLPEAANVYADVASDLHSVMPAIEDLTRGPEHEVGDTIAEIVASVHGAVARTAINLDRAGTALVQVADRFSHTDERARQEFDRLRADPRLEPGRPPPFTRPPMPGDRPPEIPHGVVKVV